MGHGVGAGAIGGLIRCSGWRRRTVLRAGSGRWRGAETGRRVSAFGAGADGVVGGPVAAIVRVIGGG